MSDLREYVISYKDDLGNVVCNIMDYYSKFVVPLDKKFNGQVLAPSHLAICPIHDDHDPSFGVMKDKRHEGVYLFHCFGCNQTGDIVSLHQKVQKYWKKRSLKEEECCKELCDLFNIPLPTDQVLQGDSPEERYSKRYNSIDKLSKRYNEAEFSRNLLNIRCSGNIDLDKVNFECVKLMMTQKGIV